MKVLVTLALALVFSGCAKEKEDPKVDAPGSLFEAEDLGPGNVSTVAAADIAGSVNDEANNLAPSRAGKLSLDDDNSVDKCIKDKLNALTFSADKANAKISETVDLTACKLFDDDSTTFTYSKAEAKVLSWFGCKNDDIEDLDGKANGDVKDEVAAFGYCKSEADVEVLINTDFNVAATVTDSAGKVMELEARAIGAQQTADGSPCKASYTDGNWTWQDGCVAYSKLTFGKATYNGQPLAINGMSDFTSATYATLVQAHDPQRWFESGSMGMKINNWTGTVTFAGGSTSPYWEMTDGSTTKSGTVVDFSLRTTGLSETLRHHVGLK